MGRIVLKYLPLQFRQDLQGLPDHKALQEVKVLRVLPDRQDQQDRRVVQEVKALPDRQGLRAQTVILVAHPLNMIFLQIQQTATPAQVR